MNFYSRQTRSMKISATTLPGTIAGNLLKDRQIDYGGPSINFFSFIKSSQYPLFCAFSALVGWSFGLALTYYEMKVTLLCNMPLLGKSSGGSLPPMFMKQIVCCKESLGAFLGFTLLIVVSWFRLIQSV